MAATLIDSDFIFNATSVSVPEHQAGDLIVAYSRRNSSSNSPGTPSGFTSLTTVSRGNGTSRLSYKVSDGNAFTLTSSTSVFGCFAIYRGADIGAVAVADSANTGVDVPALTLQDSVTGESKVCVFFYRQDAEEVTGYSGAQAMTLKEWSNQASQEGFFETNAGVSAFAGGSITTADSSNRSAYSIAVEIKDSSAAPAGPILSSAGALASTATTATVTVTTDTATGTAYCVVTASATPPSASQIKAGDDHTGTDAVWADDQAVSSAGVLTFEPTGLTAETQYYAYIVHDDGSDDSNVATAGFLTPSSTLGWIVAPTVDAVGFSTITLSALPNQACEVHAIALAPGATDVTDPDSVVRGEDGDEVAAAAHDSDTSDGSPVELTLTGLTEPVYRVRVVAYIPDPE